MNEMVERVAKAMHANTDMLWSQLPWERLGAAQELYLSLARAAIDAMREPPAIYDWHCIKYEIPIDANLDPGGVTWMDPK